jgi:hypothetical protein
LETDYTAILMATDHSWMAVLDRIFSHFTGDIHREASIWALDEGTHQRNELRPKINEEAKDFYMAISMKAQKTQEA